VLFTETALKGAYILDPEKLEDERGFFARAFCEREFTEQGLAVNWVQSSISFNHTQGTLRGMHYQEAPYEETKLVRCTMGGIVDVILDLRRDSPTFRQWVGVELTAANRRMVYVPQGVAHGFQTLTDNTEVFYEISEYYHPESARGVCWNDPAFRMEWPAPASVISKKDRSYLPFQL
jgi:dTDP-4-dehydrorhamnose 3,5-epimerase